MIAVLVNRLMLRGILAMAIFVGVSAEASVSEQAVREMVFRDCDQAISQAPFLPVADRKDFVQFLLRVLALNTEAPNVVEAFVISPGDARVRDSASQIWRSVDARLDLKAKQCALRLLEKLGTEAFAHLPELVRFYGDESLGDELAVRMEEAVAAVTERGYSAGLQISEPEIDRIIGALFLPRPLLAQNVLIETGPTIIPRLLDVILTFSDEGLRQIQPVLREVDPTRAGVLRELLQRAAGLEPEAVALAVARLGLVRSPVQAEVVDAVVEGAGRLPVPAAVPVQRLIGQFCLQAGHIVVEPAARTALTARWNELPFLFGSMPFDMQECLVRSFPELVVGLQARIRAARSTDDLRGIEPLVLAFSESGVRNGRAELFGALRHALEIAEGTGPAVLPLITLFSEHRDEALKLYFQAAKRMEKLPSEIAAPFAAAMSAGIQRSDPHGRERMIPVLLGWLRRGLTSDDLIGALSSLVPKMERELLNAWRLAGDDGKEAILQAFHRAEFWSLRSGKVCIDSLQSNRLRESSEAWFSDAAKRWPEARRFVRERAAAFHDAERLFRLVRLGVLVADEIPLLETALGSVECSAVQRSWNGIAETALRENRLDLLGPVIRRCIGEFSNDQIVAAMRMTPARIVLGEGVDRDRLFHSDRFEFIALTLMDQQLLREPEMASVVFKTALNNPSRRLQRRVLTLLRDDTSHVDGDLLVRLRELASVTDDESSVRRMALEILAARGDPEINLDSVVRQIIDRYGDGQIKPFGSTALPLLPAGIVQKSVFEALAAKESRRVVGAARVAGQLQSRGFPFVAKLWELREHPLFEVRVAVVLSLLEIAPATPGLNSAVESILVTRSFPLALDRAIRWNESAVMSELWQRPLGRLRRGRMEMLAEQARRRQI